MTDIKDNPALSLREWRPREPVDHRFLNDTNRAVDSLRAAVDGPRQVPSRGSGASGAAMFKVVSVKADYILATEFDGADEGVEEIPIAKPYLLRNSVLDRDGITFEYTNTSTRTADNGSATETQVVVPSYVVGDVVFAIRTLRGSGVSYAPTPGASQPVRWLDLNLDARAWAKESS